MDANSEKKIKVLPNGPYEVIGDIPLNQLRYVNDRKARSPVIWNTEGRLTGRRQIILCRGSLV
ncbi:MAG: hypothetical protein ACLVEJ_05185 [Parabacteroides sp.]